MGYSKFHLFFQIVTGMALLYEAAKNGPKLYGRVLVIANEVGEHYDAIETNGETPDRMADSFLEHMYNGAPLPDWMKAIGLVPAAVLATRD